ncbi:histidine--tRNA ligase [bacterium]|nr:MAG: histidine--tRNA ligase [bacterium]
MSENIRNLVEPQTLRGFQDLLPEAMIARQKIIESIRAIYDKYGFVPIDTPTLEYLETLVGQGGEGVDKELFRLESPEGEAIALRFDLTVPFARLIAQYPDRIKLPFRRYHIGPVFRADKPGPGRFRQFTQFDIDIAGPETVAADAELISAMSEVLQAVGLSNAEQSEFQIRINNRKLVDALLQGNGIEEVETQKHVLRVVDKLQKVGIGNVRAELGAGRTDESGDKIRGVNLEAEIIEAIINFISVTGSDRDDVIAKMTVSLPETEQSSLALQEMKDLASALNSLGVSEADAVFDPSLTRGLDYYTGPVFEAVLPIAPSFGSIMGGGRYDQLVERFLDKRIPATGASIGLDRLIAALTSLDKVKLAATNTKVLVVGMRGIPTDALLAIASELRAQNIATEVYYGKPKMKDQLSFANAKGIPVAIILGENELVNGEVAIKDLYFGMRSRADIEDRDEYQKANRSGQSTVPRDQMVAVVKEILEEN